ncbi:GtrA family protein [Roseobacter sp.]|uniref:GtrA family protein n=1 Tax=Roseobacter sp. TaxID=1907202 RepID=UPI0032982FC4
MTRLLRFAVIGVCTAILYSGLYVGFLSLGITRGPANALAFGLAVCAQYTGHATLTFRTPLRDTRQMARFGITVSFGFVTSAIITGWLGPRLGIPDWAAVGIAAIILPIQNYMFMTLWVFTRSFSKGPLS